MDQAHGEAAAGGSPLGSAEHLASWSEWEAYYREASRRRRARGGMRSLRRESRRRRTRERFVFMGAATFMSLMIVGFYIFFSR